MKRNIIKFAVIGGSLLGLIYGAIHSLSKASPSGRNEVHTIKKRGQIDHILASYFKDELDNVPFEHEDWINDATLTNEPLPGFLICNVRKDARSPDNGDAPNDVYPPKDPKEKDRSRTSVNRGPTYPLIPPNRPIACCPPGDKTGTPYKTGFSCCVNSVYNVTTHFCCISKSRVLRLNTEELDFCYPLDSISFCRLKELQLDKKEPMTHRCRMTRQKTPSFCRFSCPHGSQPKGGITEAICLKNGIWNTKPICCEGCPENFRLDLWFVVEVDQKIGAGGFKQLKKFLKSMLSYFPISQDGVRVGITIFNKAVYFDIGVWDLSTHNTHEAVYDAIDELPFEGSGSSTGKAFSWVANNAFTSQKGDREDVPNQVVAVLYGQPEDEFSDAALELKTIAKVKAVAIGKKIGNDDLSQIESDGVHRVDNFIALSDINKILYTSTCGENCLGSQS